MVTRKEIDGMAKVINHAVDVAHDTRNICKKFFPSIEGELGEINLRLYRLEEKVSIKKKSSRKKIRRHSHE